MSTAWFLLFTVVNRINWWLVPCEWSRPYGGEHNEQRQRDALSAPTQVVSC